MLGSYSVLERDGGMKDDTTMGVLDGGTDTSDRESGQGSLADPSGTRLALSVIIVSYNTCAMTLDCLRTLSAALSRLPSEVFLVDNASTDGTPAAVRAEFPWVVLIENDQNRGFGAANNQALAVARGEFLLLLNSDAFPEPGALASLMVYLRADPEVAAVGPRLLNADGSLQRSCFRFPSPLRCWLENLWISAALPNHPLVGDYRRWAHDAERRVDFVIGACLLVRREAYEQVGGFDEGFFMYSEETDWQRRMHAAGWQVAFTPSAEVTHLAGASGAGEKPQISRHFFHGLDRYVYKHHGLTGLVSARLAMILGCGLRALLWSGVAFAQPKRRAHARAKAGFLRWLLVRQATHWKIGGPAAGKAAP